MNETEAMSAMCDIFPALERLHGKEVTGELMQDFFDVAKEDVGSGRYIWFEFIEALKESRRSKYFPKPNTLIETILELRAANKHVNAVIPEERRLGEGVKLTREEQKKRFQDLRKLILDSSGGDIDIACAQRDFI